ncbi:hypothetical protein, partial [Streptomyces sp. NPDC004285]
MDAHADKQPPKISGSYAESHLARAFVTALTDADPATRARAEERVRGWRRVLAGMTDGTLRIGSRTPVEGLPAWVTPEVLRGGFATGAPSAGGPLLPYEAEAARRAGLPEDRAALFAHSLTEEGLTELWALLDTARYEIAVPEEAALLTVAWLVRAGEADAALELVDELRPFAGRLRFTPRPSQAPAPDTGNVHRRTVAEAGAALARRRPNGAVEAQREALAVWRPFADDLLRHWLETAGPDHRVFGREPDAGWHARGAALLDRYRDLAREHTLCGGHRDPKGNVGILRGALEETTAGRPLDARRTGLLRHAVTSMVRKRGLPGSERHTVLRDTQAAQAALPSHQALAHLVAERLSGLPQDVGAADVAPLVAPVTETERRATGLPAGTAVPPAIRRVVEGARSAPLATLVELGVVPSAEAMAELVPQLVAAETAAGYEDGPLRALMAANYRAFRRRRSLLLLDLARQVRPGELPWVRAVSARRVGDARSERSAHAALRQLGEVTVDGFPGTLLPNPLVRELGVLAGRAGLDAPLVEELAADIFMGTFSPKFQSAAAVAAELLGGGSLYERYYGIDYGEVLALAGNGSRSTGARIRRALSRAGGQARLAGRGGQRHGDRAGADPHHAQPRHPRPPRRSRPRLRLGGAGAPLLRHGVPSDGPGAPRGAPARHDQGRGVRLAADALPPVDVRRRGGGRGVEVAAAGDGPAPLPRGGPACAGPGGTAARGGRGLVRRRRRCRRRTGQAPDRLGHRGPLAEHGPDGGRPGVRCPRAGAGRLLAVSRT